MHKRSMAVGMGSVAYCATWRPFWAPFRAVFEPFPRHFEPVLASLGPERGAGRVAQAVMNYGGCVWTNSFLKKHEVQRDYLMLAGICCSLQ